MEIFRIITWDNFSSSGICKCLGSLCSLLVNICDILAPERLFYRHTSIDYRWPLKITYHWTSLNNHWMGMDLLRVILDPYLNNFLIKTQFYFPITKTPFWAWGATQILQMLRICWKIWNWLLITVWWIRIQIDSVTKQTHPSSDT